MFKVLSLDGGGVRGAFSAAVLSQLDAAAKRPLVDCFDLIVGTSTDSVSEILAARQLTTGRWRCQAFKVIHWTLVT